MATFVLLLSLLLNCRLERASERKFTLLKSDDDFSVRAHFVHLFIYISTNLCCRPRSRKSRRQLLVIDGWPLFFKVAIRQFGRICSSPIRSVSSVRKRVTKLRDGARIFSSSRSNSHRGQEQRTSERARTRSSDRANVNKWTTKSMATSSV